MLKTSISIEDSFLHEGQVKVTVQEGTESIEHHGKKESILKWAIEVIDNVENGIPIFKK